MDDEKRLIRRARQGDAAAFTELVETYEVPVFNLCYRMLGGSEDAEDAAQETFLRAFQFLHRYDDSRPFPTWLLSIGAHYCIDTIRRRRFSLVSLDSPDEPATAEGLADPTSLNPEVEVIRRQGRAEVQRMLQHLGAVDRAAVVMRYWHDLSEVEIAAALQISVSAVKSRLHRARRALAGVFTPEAAERPRERRPHESPAV